MDEWITPTEAAAILKRTRARVHQLCKSGVLRYEYQRKVVSRADVEALAANPPPIGRPRKAE